ncbi:MAG: tetratricopeptide repeat protein [Microcoleaceae cyanobacterium MO_207.B10]|nr:tetratricopeptide repeat protein [Microcoleaceae cyanobacterium MO_207.B10]
MFNNQNTEKVATDFYQIAESSLAQGKLEQAYAACLKVLKSQPEFAPACKTLGDILQAKGDIETAKTYYKKAIKIFQNFAEAHANLGSMYAKQKHWQEAIFAYEKALSIKPNLVGVHRNLAKIWQHLGKEELTIKCTYQALILEPESATATEHLNIGNKLLELGESEAAFNCYSQAVKMNPNLSTAYQNLGEILTQKGELEEALVVLNNAIKLNSKHPRGYYLLGEVLKQKKQYDLAIFAYSRAIELKPDNHLFHKKLGDVFQEREEVEQAIACYQKSIEVQPNFFWGYYSLGNIYAKQQRWNEAIYAYRQATIINPNFSDGFYNLANALSQKSQKEEAINAYLEAVKLKPDSPLVNNNLLWKYLLKNRLQEVLNIYQEAIKNEQNNFLCHLKLGEIFTEIGNMQVAITCYETACYHKTRQSYPMFVQQNWNSQNTRRPNFIIIGAQKSGTTSLENYISQHPQVIPAIKKETHFWYRDFNKGINWYLAHFPPIPKSQNFITGEATPNYLEYYNSAKRIYDVFPDVKLLVILRNPVDRAVSQYYHWVRIKREKRSLEKAIDSELEMLLKNPDKPQGDSNYWQQEPGNYIGRGIYVEFIKKWMEIFPRKQFIILKGEDLYEKPTMIMKQVFDFLGLPEYKLQNYRKFNAGYYQPINQSCRQKLSAYFQPHNQRLEEYLGLKFDW